MRPRSMPVNRFQFGKQTITTQVNIMVPRDGARVEHVDVTAAMDERPQGKRVALNVLAVDEDPFAEVQEAGA